jgi:hypothetical protein
MSLQGLKGHSRLGVVLPVLLAMFLGTPAVAFQFNLGEVNGSLDSTLSYGLSWRMADRDKDIIGLANGGKAYSLNGDDGNLNYDDGDLISNTAKITSELALDYNNFGLFVRGTAFYDFENQDGDRARTQLSDDVLDLVGKDAQLLDAYLWWSFKAGDTPGQLRVGDQVLSWGESTFIQNGINVINPFNLGALRVPGAELKEGLLPVGMVSASISPTENLTFEAFYQYDWEKVEIDPTGTYWSANDFAGESGDRVMLGFGDWSDQGTSWATYPAPWGLLGYPDPETSNSRFNMVPRGSDVYADDDGQYGLAMRVYAPGLNNTEFGFYYMNYHSRLPIISGKTGSATGAIKAGVAATTAGNLAGGNTLPGSIAAGTSYPVQVAPGVYVPASAVLGAATATQVATNAANAALVGGAPLAKGYATTEYAETAQYFLEYPEDIKLFGVSFNTTVDSIGASLQGEYSYRKDAPLQVDDVELLLAALSPLNNPATNILSDNQLGVYGLDTYIAGYKELDVSQVQMTLTKLFGPTLKADQFTFVTEVGWTHVHNMPSKDSLRFESAGTYVTGNPNQADDPLGRGAHQNKTAEPSGAFADADSWGYRMVGKLDFNNAIGAVTLSPRIAWSHDVDGNTPGPGGNFLEGRKAITFGLGADYQNTWSADLSYTDFFGAGRYNLLNDRDFVALNIKYSF